MVPDLASPPSRPTAAPLDPTSLAAPPPLARRIRGGGGEGMTPDLTLLMVWVEMGFLGWILMGIVIGGLNCVVLANGLGWSGFYVNAG